MSEQLLQSNLLQEV